MCNDEAEVFCKLCIPHEPAGAVQIAGPAKPTAYNTQRTGGSRFRAGIQRGAAPERPVPTALPTCAQLQVA